MRLPGPFRTAGMMFLAMAAGIAPLHAGEWNPFVLPWDDASPTVTDFSSLNHTPAGKFGYIEATPGGHLAVAGERIRFLGVNITSSSCFPTSAEADRIAPRLAKFGMNIVRFHHMDNSWGGGSLINYATGNSRTLNPVTLDRLDYFIARLKENGIYVNLNLVNSRDFRAADGLDPGIASMDWKERHILGMVDPVFRDLEKEYATQLLRHINSYTGLSYADDPAIAVVEINNENGLLHRYFGGGLESWPDVYAEQLQAGWNRWLSDRHTSTADMVEFWNSANTVLGDSILENPDFMEGLNAWNLEQHQGAVASATTGEYDGRPGLRLEVVEPGSAGWHVQLNQRGLSLEKGNLYTIKFRVKADADMTLNVEIGQAYDPWKVHHSFSSIEVTTEWEEKTILFTSTVTDTNLRINFNGFAGGKQVVYFSGINLQSGGGIEADLPPGISLETGTVPVNRIGESYPLNRQRDWIRYLRELELDYWSDMRDHIRFQLGYKGLISGTTIMNSPPNIQGIFDLADTHAYWRHPVFPGISWDSSNWYVRQDSMVNFLDTTIADLSRQRLDGYPHTVSEYRHAYPNRYASEGPLLISAYAAMQDWDGLYFFDYSKGSSWGQGYVGNYFNMNQHPTAMANALIAVNLFRRGDVSPDGELLRMQFSPEQEVEVLTTGGKAWNVGDARQLNVNAAHALTSRIALSIGEGATGLTGEPPAPAPGPVYRASDNELEWDLTTPGKGRVLVNTDRTKAAIGFIDGQDLSLGNVGMQIGSTRAGWATVSLTLKEGSYSFPGGGGRMIVVAAGIMENTDMGWTDASQTSVGTNWGRSPTKVEMIPATLVLPYPADRVQAWALDETGSRLENMPVSPAGEVAELEIGTAIQSLWYEILVSPDPDLSPMEMWTGETFTPQQRMDASISGVSADPDKDGRPNALEFMFGSDPFVEDGSAAMRLRAPEFSSNSGLVCEFLKNRDFPTEAMHIETTVDLEEWIRHEVLSPDIDLTMIPEDDQFERVRIEYQGQPSPSFLRISITP